MTLKHNHKKFILILIKLTITIAAIWFVIKKVNTHDISGAIYNVQFSWLMSAFFVACFQSPLVGFRWWYILESFRESNLKSNLAQVQAINAIGIFFNQILPSPVGETIRVYGVHRRGLGLDKSIFSVILDRIIGLYSFFLVGFIIFFFPQDFQIAKQYQMETLLILGIIVIIGPILVTLKNPLSKINGNISYISKIKDFFILSCDILFGKNGKKTFIIATLIQILTLIFAVFIAESLHLPMTFYDVATVFFCMMFLTMLPISIGGWGVREILVVAMLSELDIAAESAVAFSVLFGFISITSTMPSAIYGLYKVDLKKII